MYDSPYMLFMFLLEPSGGGQHCEEQGLEHVAPSQTIVRHAILRRLLIIELLDPISVYSFFKLMIFFRQAVC